MDPVWPPKRVENGFEGPAAGVVEAVSGFVVEVDDGGVAAVVVPNLIGELGFQVLSLVTPGLLGAKIDPLVEPDAGGVEELNRPPVVFTLELRMLVVPTLEVVALSWLEEGLLVGVKMLGEGVPLNDENLVFPKMDAKGFPESFFSSASGAWRLGLPS